MKKTSIKTVAELRKEATAAHDEILSQLGEGYTYVGDEAAEESARRKMGVLMKDLKEIEKDIKHYLSPDLHNVRYVWASFAALTTFVAAAVREEEIKITY